jgi:hypothetical protein
MAVQHRALTALQKSALHPIRRLDDLLLIRVSIV